MYSFTVPGGSLPGLKVLDLGAIEYKWESEQLRLPNLTRLVMNELSLKKVKEERTMSIALQTVSLQQV